MFIKNVKNKYICPTYKHIYDIGHNDTYYVSTAIRLG